MSRTILMASEMRIESNLVGVSLGTFRQKYTSKIAALKTFSAFLSLMKKVERTDFRETKVQILTSLVTYVTLGKLSHPSETQFLHL